MSKFTKVIIKLNKDFKDEEKRNPCIKTTINRLYTLNYNATSSCFTKEELYMLNPLDVVLFDEPSEEFKESVRQVQHNIINHYSERF